MTANTLRRLLHALSPLVLLPALWWSWDDTRRLLIVLAVGAVITEWVRRIVPAARVFLERTVPVWRAHESNRFSGAAWLAIAFAVAAHAPMPAALGGILAAAWADPAGSLVGGWLGRGPGKTLPGMLAVLVVATAVSMGVGYPPTVALVAGVVASVAERWATSPDDNFWLAPLVAVTLLAFA